MTGHNSWQSLRSRMPDDPKSLNERQAYVQAAQEAIALGKLRESRGLTQVEVADVLGTSQANVSRLEREDNPYLSTLRSYVEALGGELVLAARFPDGSGALLQGSRWLAEAPGDTASETLLASSDG